MNNLTPTQKINNLILILEAKQELQYKSLKSSIDETIETIQPSNFATGFIKSLLFTKQAEAPLLASLIQLASHWISQKQTTEGPKSFIRKLADASIQYITKNLFSTNKF